MDQQHQTRINTSDLPRPLLAPFGVNREELDSMVQNAEFELEVEVGTGGQVH